ncbi:vacuolar protein sorting-associated protein VTA1 homolog [Drosophila sulfurigaster albostrigata]|uniref:vacuolar protein sorting-associated protein VTA1 homolog n=1 Tax=Drosophila sulfurigaster albostrigata TaxID=89887 RepID=UPI002D21B0B7|nr:vacuolar protein sorting-associated protein VTA1 homolog [Drosophila sulfurigaster albostrigata]
MEFPPCPPSLKSIQHFLKLAQEHDSRDVVIAYWARLYALQIGLKASSQSAEETKLLLAIMDWLEQMKKQHVDNEALTNDIAAQAHIENYALKLFLYADKQDREENFGKNVVKAYYSSGVLYDILLTFGELSEEALHNRKYAKYKAAYIHNCLKNGETPIPGPFPDDESAELGDNLASGSDNAGAGAGSQSDLPDESPSEDVHPIAPTTPSPPAPHITPPTAEEVLNNPNKLPSPPVEEEKPGGFEPYVPTAQPNAATYIPIVPVAGVQITPDQMITAQKYCKYAGSALNYDDVKTAIENLQKALKLLSTGSE